MTRLTPSKTVAVIGAGLAGLACAQRLQASGWAVTLFEQGDLPGGRMRSCGGAGWQCDHGAQYFTARDPAFAAVVEAWIARGVAAVWPARVASWDGAAMRASQGGLTRFVGVPDMGAPARALAAALTIRLGSSVRSLQRNGDSWQLQVAEDATSRSCCFDTVLLAVPAALAAALLADSVPTLATAAANARMQPAWAVVLRFDRPVDPGYEALFVNAGPLRWVARDSSKPGRQGVETWLLHATADWSQAHLGATPETVIASVLPASAALGLPLPQSCDAYRWTVASTEPAVQIGCAWDAPLSIGICGDWLAGGKVEGAWQSGVALAARVGAGDAACSGQE
ncbi:NAD(P)/FAD-dependent oxidoreductase [Xanthomonas arboricola]|uniref:NAD/FAD-dependent oxidoreductase n=1 Tax=Xanthomonas arboricola pv. guizotiae TaxID=487867 RepID=A0A2S6ZW18_9XANT|nr:FAD-dependent oxidoreductase [Xanthomonas arboricola]PPT96844.1 NAD/FAD-dependent oxidoreductase [Xanthomonas arboricola pv. guizotiae]PPU21022.1 NAD/FAD-dependent oxidoreductase [Xanthomonas arboricola pv. guizotiae]